MKNNNSDSLKFNTSVQSEIVNNKWDIPQDIIVGRQQGENESKEIYVRFAKPIINPPDYETKDEEIITKKDIICLNVIVNNKDKYSDFYVEADSIENWIDGHKCIDLGLSVLWDTCNLGADSPTEEGDLVGWGNNTLILDCDLNHFPCTNVPISIKGTEYDNVHNRWGGRWRMPTLSELKELKDECTWDKVKDEADNYCYKVIGPNGNSIYLPLPGVEISGKRNHRQSMGFLWPSDIYSGTNQFAANLSYGIRTEDRICLSGYYRYARESVRPVIVK